MVFGGSPSTADSGQEGEESINPVETLYAEIEDVWQAFATGDRKAIQAFQERQKAYDRETLQRILFGRQLKNLETGELAADTPSGFKNILKAWMADSPVGFQLLTVDVCGSPLSSVDLSAVGEQDVGYKLCGLPVEGDDACDKLEHPNRRDADRLGIVVHRGPKFSFAAKQGTAAPRPMAGVSKVFFPPDSWTKFVQEHQFCPLLDKQWTKWTKLWVNQMHYFRST